MRTAILVPARDEEASLPGLFDALREVGPPEGSPEVLVVDNGSTDGTADVARRLGARVIREPRAGYGRACRRGLAHLAGRAAPPDAVLFLDADDWMAARYRERLLAPLRKGAAELVIGGRRPRRGERGLPLHARLGNELVSGILRGIYGVPLRDPGPCRAARLDALLRLGLDDPDFGWNVQMQVRALRAGYRVVEIPIEFERRRRGRSKISGAPVASARAAVAMLATLWGEASGPPGARSEPGVGPGGSGVAGAGGQPRAETKN